MNKKQGVPIIGGKKTQPPGIQMQELIPAIVAQLTPTLDIILENVTALEQRMAVVEEVKQLFPAKIEVIVKHEPRPMNEYEQHQMNKLKEKK